MERSLEVQANFLRPALTSGALWILCHAEHGFTKLLRIDSAPEAIDGTNLRGLIKRGLIFEGSDVGVYRITPLGQVILDRFRQALR